MVFQLTQFNFHRPEYLVGENSFQYHFKALFYSLLHRYSQSNSFPHLPFIQQFFIFPPSIQVFSTPNSLRFAFPTLLACFFLPSSTFNWVKTLRFTCAVQPSNTSPTATFYLQLFRINQSSDRKKETKTWTRTNARKVKKRSSLKMETEKNKRNQERNT